MRFSLLILALLVLVSYANSLNNQFVSDDIFAIRDNPDIAQISSFWKAPFFNLRGFTLFLIHKIFGLNPLFYRLPNIFFHLGSTLLLYFLLGLSSALTPLPFFAASIFAVHPLLSEAVTWISGGTYVEYSFFFLLSLLFYILSQKKKGFYILSLAAILVSLAINEKAMVFPLALILYEAALGNIYQNWKKVIPFFVLGAASVLMNLLKLGQRVAVLEAQYYHAGGMDNPLIQIPIATTSYLQLLFWPKGLTIYHSEMTFTYAEYLLRVGIFILFLGIIIYCYKRSRQAFFWLAFFIISLLPTLTPLRISWIVAERYVYLGAGGIFVVVAMALTNLSQIKKLKLFSYLVFSLIVISLSLRTIIRNIDWKNEDNLWIATGKTSPSSPNTHNNLGYVYGKRKDLKKAAQEFQKAIEIKPNYADAYHNLAHTYLEMGKVDEAIENYQKAISFNPKLWQSYQNLAAIYFAQGRYGLAEENLIQALKIKPQNSALRNNLGIVYLKQGKNLQAEDEFKKARARD